MTKQLPYRTFLLWLPNFRELVISYAVKEDYLDYVEELELPPHYNDDQTYRAVQRDIDEYLRTEGEKVILGRALDWADMELLRITREHWAWQLRQRIARLHAHLDSIERANKRSPLTRRQIIARNKAYKRRNRKSE